MKSLISTKFKFVNFIGDILPGTEYIDVFCFEIGV